jgi:transitional endoplasmic reticulum ATPase
MVVFIWYLYVCVYNVFYHIHAACAGIGKSTLLRALEHTAPPECVFLRIDAGSLFKSEEGASERALADVFSLAHAHVRVRRSGGGVCESKSLAVVVLDHVDMLSPAPSKSLDLSSEQKQTTHVLQHAVSLIDACAGTSVVCVGVTNRWSAVAPALRANGKLNVRVQVNPFSLQERRDVLERLLAHTDTQLLSVEGFENADAVASHLAEATFGYSGADLCALARALMWEAARKSANTDTHTLVLSESAFQGVMRASSSSLLSASSFNVLSQAQRDRVECPGGMGALMQELEMELVFPITHAQAYAALQTRLGVKPPSGLLFYGPTGTGKTMCAQYLAARTNMNTFHVNASELVSKFIGGSV